MYTQTVDYQGFVLVHDPEKRGPWLARYTRCCAEGHLARKRAPHGTWYTHVYRLLDKRTSPRRQHSHALALNRLRRETDPCPMPGAAVRHAPAAHRGAMACEDDC